MAEEACSSATEEACFFQWKFHCEKKTERLSVSGKARIDTIIQSSLIYQDGIHELLNQKISKDSEFTIRCHKNCATTYNSPTQLKRHLKRQQKGVDVIAPKKTRKSDSKTFTFQEHCLFCGESCELVPDPKHPDRWKPAYLFRTIGSNQKSLKQALSEICSERNDDWAAAVQNRLTGALSDLHAADARYHVHCRVSFTGSRAVASASRAGTSSEQADVAFDNLVADLQSDLSRIWNSIELFETYKEYGGQIASRQLLLKQLTSHFGEDLMVLSSPGISSIVAFRSKASSVLRLVEADDDEIDIAISKVSKHVKADAKNISVDKMNYDIQMSHDRNLEYVSETLLDLLAKISPKLDRTLPAVLIGSIITSVLCNHPTSLQISLGVLMRSSKKLVSQLHEFGVTCSPDEVLRFKKSAAQAAMHSMDLSGISTEPNSRLVQVLADNFDADISSPNGKLSTHSLAILLTQPINNHSSDKTLPTIPRIKKEHMSDPVDYEIDIQRYNGPNKPDMPQNCALKTVLPLKFLIHQQLAKQRAEEFDFAFFEDVITKPECAEFNGYNTAISRDQGHSVKPKTKAVYLPLIDMVPSDPDTMMTALVKAQGLMEMIGQKYVIFTCDLQLYRVAVQVIWAYPDRFSNVIMRLGGMHSLMSFVGAIGTLMADTGLAELMSEVFGGVPKMLSGKKFPQNVRAMRMVVEELLRPIILTKELYCQQDLIDVLDELASKSKTTKLWVNMLIKPVFIMMLFVRAERESDWPLHLHAFRQMLPYYFAAGHVNYARYGLYYLRSMEALPADVLPNFMKGEHTMHHVPGIWNGIWSDMFIETTFMRYGHGRGGIIGNTLKPETLKIWALSLHICSHLESDLDQLALGDRRHTEESHKEEQKSRIASDAEDRTGLRRKLDLCIDPLDPEKHSQSDHIVNISSGCISPDTVNVHHALEMGQTLMQKFEDGWGPGFYGTIHKPVQTMSLTKKHVSVGQEKVFDTNLIYSRVIGLQASNRQVDITNVLSHELAPIPTAMFTDSGEMRITKAKSALKNLLQVTIPTRTAEHTSVTVIDGSAFLWVVNWPKSGTVKDYINNFEEKLKHKLLSGDVYLVFDRYYEYSTKSVARYARSAEASRVHQLEEGTTMPSQKVVLTVSENKRQLVELICTDLIQNVHFHQNCVHRHKLVITGHYKTPTEISHHGIVIPRRDMDTTQEEADTIMVHQVLLIADENPDAGISVLSDDTDVFILLCHVYCHDHLQVHLIMESPIKDRVVVDIAKTVDKHRAIIPELLPAHALSGCDTVACCYGIGKGTVLKTVQSGYSLSLLGQPEAPIAEVIEQATKFMIACYGQKECDTMSSARLKAWATKTGKGYTSIPKLCSLPPTSESFTENVKRAHHQAILWRSLKMPDPPVLDIEEFGWRKDVANKTLLPVTVPENVMLAPLAILRLIKCGCHSDSPCRTSRCGCRSASLSCTIFCGCQMEGCHNVPPVAG